jgi:PXA domain
MRTIAEGMATFMLDRNDSSKPMLRVIARELLACCVLRSIMGIFSPHFVNKVALGVMV